MRVLPVRLKQSIGPGITKEEGTLIVSLQFTGNEGICRNLNV